jgi:predicted nuclease of predicted toxin-antitoxin system
MHPTGALFSCESLTWIRTDSPGITDPVVLARAQAELQILLTFDKDFGELAFRSKLPASIGIILFRVRGKSGLEIARKVAHVIASRDDWAGHFSVVEEHRIRIRDL